MRVSSSDLNASQGDGKKSIKFSVVLELMVLIVMDVVD